MVAVEGRSALFMRQEPVAPSVCLLGGTASCPLAVNRADILFSGTAQSLRSYQTGSQRLLFGPSRATRTGPPRLQPRVITFEGGKWEEAKNC